MQHIFSKGSFFFFLKMEAREDYDTIPLQECSAVLSVLIHRIYEMPPVQYEVPDYVRVTLWKPKVKLKTQ